MDKREVVAMAGAVVAVLAPVLLIQRIPYKVEQVELVAVV